MASLSSNDIISSALDSRFIKDPYFAGSSIKLRTDGSAYTFGGGFSQVFQINKNQSDWAFKVWKQDIPEIELRYALIKEHLNHVALPYFSDFEFVAKGLLVNGDFVPSLRMPWMDGELLKHYVNFHINDTNIIKKLADDFLTMTKVLHENSISHGDLKNDNIFVTTDGDIKLIDYDAICVPKLANKADFCKGTRGYQHPMRFMYDELTSTKTDHFSELIIYLSIRAIAENPLLWEKYSVMTADYRLIFTFEDLWGFNDSDIRKDLMLLSEEIQYLVKKLDSYLAAFLYLPPIAE